MQLLLGLFFFFILLTTGSSLTCEHCVSSTSDTCSGSKNECAFKNAVCMTLITETTILVKIVTVMKSCSQKDECKRLQEQKGGVLSSPLPNMTAAIPSFQIGAVINDVICDRAPPSFPPFFPAFLGLLLMKLLF